MPIHAKTNLYPGVNAHLNSFLQRPGNGWGSFHHGHVEHLREAVEQCLPETYYADNDRSLQIRGQGLGRITLDNEDNYLRSVVVYQIDKGILPGKPITRIELLSPANKPGCHYHEAYMNKRAEVLRGGMPLVEIDYLDHTKPLLPQIPSYRDGAPGAYPYTVLISNPHQPVEALTLRIKRFGVCEPIPTIPIPVAGIEDVLLDLGAVYNHTLESRRAWVNVVDYAAEPPAFDRYRPDDQAKIRALLEGIRREHKEVP